MLNRKRTSCYGVLLAAMLACCPLLVKATTCPVQTPTGKIEAAVAAQPLRGDGRLCAPVEVAGHTLHYGFGMSVGRIRPSLPPNATGADVVLSDRRPPRLTYTWYDKQNHTFKRETIFDGPTFSECSQRHSAPAGADCLVFESNFIADIDCDGYNDVVVVSYSHPVSVFWFKNPGKQGGGWRRYPISNVAFNETTNVDLNSQTSKHSLPELALYRAAPVKSRRLGVCQVVDVVTSAHRANSDTGITLYRNPISRPGVMNPDQVWQSRPVKTPSGLVPHARTLLQLPAPTAMKFEARAAAASLLVAPHSAEQPQDPFVVQLTPASNNFDLEIATVHKVTGYAFTTGALATLLPGRQFVVLPRGYFGTYQPEHLVKEETGICQRYLKHQGVSMHEWDPKKQMLTASGDVFADRYPWPHAVAAGRVSRSDVDDLIIGTMCTYSAYAPKPGQATVAEEPASTVVYCENTGLKGSAGPAFECSSLADNLPGVPFVAIRDLDGDGVNDVVAQTNGFGGKDGTLLWFKGVKRPIPSATSTSSADTRPKRMAK